MSQILTQKQLRNLIATEVKKLHKLTEVKNNVGVDEWFINCVEESIMPVVETHFQEHTDDDDVLMAVCEEFKDALMSCARNVLPELEQRVAEGDFRSGGKAPQHKLKIGGGSDAEDRKMANRVKFL